MTPAAVTYEPKRLTQPASTVAPKRYVEVISAWRYGASRYLTVHEFYMAVARLGGHQNRKHDHPPSWLVLWRGWAKLENTMLGVLAVERARCG